MKFGLFYELSVPRPWTRESERTVYNNALEQVRLADELGPFFQPLVTFLQREAEHCLRCLRAALRHAQSRR